MAYATGACAFHVQFGLGGNDVTVDFDKAGRKMVLDSFGQKAW